MEKEMRELTAADVSILKSSEDRRELKRTAVAFAASTLPNDHKILSEHLATADFLARLDSDEDYQGTYISLRLARVIKTLMDNRTPSTDEVLLSLVDAPEYQSDVLRMQLEIRALAVVNPSPPEAVSYWDGRSQPGSPIAYDVIDALCTNQSEPALELLERKFIDSNHDEHDKLGWMRELILPRRNDVPLLACCEKLVTGSLPEDLRRGLVEALFDYQPDEWYIVCEPPEPPLRAEAILPAREALARIGQYALDNLPLDERQEKAVKVGLEELEDQS